MRYNIYMKEKKEIFMSKANKENQKFINMSQATKGEKYKISNRVVIFQDVYIGIASGIHYEFLDPKTEEILDFSEYDNIQIQEL